MIKMCIACVQAKAIYLGFNSQIAQSEKFARGFRSRVFFNLSDGILERAPRHVQKDMVLYNYIYPKF